jgi:hypothetical protein
MIAENPSVIDKLKNKYIVFAIGLTVLAYLLYIATYRRDFYIYILASKDLFANKDIYALTYIDGYHYYYSILFACLIYPLSKLPIYIATVIWLMMNFFFLVRLIKIIGSYFKLTVLTIKQQWIFLAMCTAGCLKFAISNIEAQQITICILYLTLQGLELIWKDKKVLGALLIALAINFKILPIFLIPYLIFRKEFVAYFFIFVFYGLMFVIPALFIGKNHNIDLLYSWWGLINPTNAKHIVDTEEGGFNSLTTWLATLLVYEPPRPHDPHLYRNIASISVEKLELIINITRLLFLGFAAYFVRIWPFNKIEGKMQRYWEISYFLLITPLLFPHQQYYSFLLVTPALCFIYYHFITHYQSMSKRKYRLMITAFIASFILCNLPFLAGQFNSYWSYFKTLTYGVLIIVPLLAVSVPENESEQTT